MHRWIHKETQKTLIGSFIGGFLMQQKR